MGSGMTEYWKNKKLMQREQQVKRAFFALLSKLLKKDFTTLYREF